jgi:hypothetical protein
MVLLKSITSTSVQFQPYQRALRLLILILDSFQTQSSSPIPRSFMSVVEASLGVSPEREAWATEPSSSGLQPALSDQPPLCADCPKETRRPATSSCLECDRVYCDACWADRGPHKRGDSGHERVPIRGSPMEDLTPIL